MASASRRDFFPASPMQNATRVPGSTLLYKADTTSQSRSDAAMTAIFTISAPKDFALSTVLSSTERGGVKSKLWYERISTVPHSWQAWRMRRPMAAGASISRSTYLAPAFIARSRISGAPGSSAMRQVAMRGTSDWENSCSISSSERAQRSRRISAISREGRSD